MSDAPFTMDVKEFPSLKEFPEVGNMSVMYVDKLTGKSYRWTGKQYSEMVSDSSESKKKEVEMSTETELRAQIAKYEKEKQEALSALGIVAAANRRVGYTALIIGVMWLNGFRYVETKWEMFFSLFGYTIYLSLIRTVDWFHATFTGLFSVIIEAIARSNGGY